MTPQQHPEPEIPSLTRTQVLVAMGVTAIILWVVAKICLKFSGVSLMTWHWHQQDFVVGLGIGIAITFFSGLGYKIFAPYRQSVDYYLDIVLKPLALPDLIWLGLLPGLSEELLFRGVLIPALGLNHFAIVISSLSFGILHLSAPHQWIYVIWATVVGLIFGYSALITGNLLVPIIAHITTNLASSYLWKVEKSNIFTR